MNGSDKGAFDYKLLQLLMLITISVNTTYNKHTIAIISPVQEGETKFWELLELFSHHGLFCQLSNFNLILEAYYIR